jgi:hypothetical protein
MRELKQTQAIASKSTPLVLSAFQSAGLWEQHDLSTTLSVIDGKRMSNTLHNFPQSRTLNGLDEVLMASFLPFMILISLLLG